jgi:hypothetical protein
MAEESSRGSEHADWREVGFAFAALGDQMRSHFHRDESSPQRERAEGEAFTDFRNSVEEALSNLQATINDPGVDQAAKAASDSLIDALKTELDSSWNPTRGS